MSNESDVNKTNVLRECIICNSWYSLKINFRFQSKVSDGYLDLMQKAVRFNDSATVSIKRNNYRIHFWYMSKDEAINF